MNLKKIKTFLIFFSLIFSAEIKAENYQFLKSLNTKTGIEIYGVDSTGNSTILNSYNSINNDSPEGTNSNFSSALLDQYQGKIYFRHSEFQSKWNGSYDELVGAEHFYLSYDLIENKIEKITSIDDKTIIYPKGIRTMISKKADGSVHIGENSAVFKEENGVEKFWATDASGKSIPINITNGSKLLINGRDVEQSIDNVGALSAALTGLPTVPTDSPVACGIGTGLHGGNYAFSGGCASKVNEKLSFNAAASFVPGQDYQGIDNSYSARAGFVFKLGKIEKPNLISFKDKKIIDQKISTLERNNKNLKEKNEEIISQNQKLLARLEKLENIALKIQSNSEMISVASED